MKSHLAKAVPTLLALLLCLGLLAGTVEQAHANAAHPPTHGGPIQYSCPYVYIGYDSIGEYVYLNDCAIQEISNSEANTAARQSLIVVLLTGAVGAPVGVYLAIFTAEISAGIEQLKADSEGCNNRGALLEYLDYPPAFPVPVAVC